MASEAPLLIPASQSTPVTVQCAFQWIPAAWLIAVGMLKISVSILMSCFILLNLLGRRMVACIVALL